MFKVKTTNIKNYMVRPNAEVIPSDHSLSVKIVTQASISKSSQALINDRFLVQLTKLDEPPTKTLTPDEIGVMWDKIDKAKLVQYKLKVELSPEVQASIKTAPGDENASAADRKDSVMTNLKTTVADKMLVDHRDKHEESKAAMPRHPRVGKG